MAFTPLRDLKDLRQAFADLIAPTADDDNRASYELAMTTREFCHNTKKVVDDKLSFSAVLMRAGEVDAANRLMQEFEQDVRVEEAALVERANELRFSRVLTKRKVHTRAATTVAAAFLGSSLLAFSAAGMAVASIIHDRANPSAIVHALRSGQTNPAHSARGATANGNRASSKHRVSIGGLNVALSPSQYQAYRRLSSGSATPSEMEQLLSLLPQGVAAQVKQTIGVVTQIVPTPSVSALPKAVWHAAKKQAQSGQNDAGASSDQPKPDPSSGSSDQQQSPPSHHKKQSHDGSNKGGNTPLPSVGIGGH
jgi:hypothetical protein